MSFPNQFGLPCWSREQVAKVISITAQTSADSTSSFLAAHSPFRQILDGKTKGRTVSEEEVFKDIFSKSRGQIQAFVKGDPGTGKSHLIRWLYERCQHGIREAENTRDEKRVVLVTRGNGSLKDALSQIVRQLGSEFERHINRVQGAIDRLSGQTARAMLLAELALEIDTKWVNEHSRAPLPPALRRLGESLRSDGFGTWMMREGSVIDQIIQRLTVSSTVEDRETFPSFQSSDFDVPVVAFRRQEVSQQVYNFIAEDLKEEPETRDLVAATLNTALNDAIRSLTGLKGSDLLTIFTEIRRQLGSDRQLLILIEDVSVTGLDQDIVNAFEPRNEEGLCRMIAILGITTNAWDRMPDNQKQRATHQFEVGGDTVNSWVSDREEVGKFTARYLNAIRSTDEEIHAIAEDRFNGDIRKSRCEDCPCKQECHSAFGYADFGNNVTVGMFPFNMNAPQAMLKNLSEARYKSQRGLLDRILLPALDQSFSSLNNRDFPRSQFFAIQPPPIQYWIAGFIPRYCNSAGWNDSMKSRLRFLAQLWFDEPTAEALAAGIKPLLKPLGFPEFSGKVEGKLPKTQPKPQTGNPPIESVEKTTEFDKELQRLNALLEKWHDGEPLKEDNKFRGLLSSLLITSIRWRDSRCIPISEKKRLIDMGGTNVPRIEGQTMRPSGTYFFDFPRDNETLEILQSLLMLSRSPSKNWDFSHGEVHKRSVSRWLRKHRSRVIQSVQPKMSGTSIDILRPAVQALALVAFLRDRKHLSSDRVERIASLFKPIWEPSESPVVMSPELRQIVHDLEEKHSSLRDFVVQELGAGQGDSTPNDFIDSRPLLDILDAFEKDFNFDSPPEEADSGYWGPRFSSVKNLRKGAFQTIPDRLIKEREAVLKAVQSVESFVNTAGFEVGDLRERLVLCMEEFKSLIEMQRGSQHKKGLLEIHNESFETLWKERLFQDANVRSSWSVAFERASEVSSESDVSCLLVFNPCKIKQCCNALDLASIHLELIERHLQDELEVVGVGGDSRSLLLADLEVIANLSKPV